VLRLGVIGLSEGNGHPYSWSAIFNGYDAAAMESCGFPSIPRYLEKQRFPEDAIAEARVTHVWAQDRKLAAHIARASRIEHVTDRYTEMIGQVDGVLLARDDAETHYEFAAPFLRAGLPVYIDKPLALTVADARRLFDTQQYAGQIFSCSALRYAKELQLSAADRAQVGALRHVHATSPKGWDEYAAHVIELVMTLAGPGATVADAQALRDGDSTTLSVRFGSGLRALISTLGPVHAPLGMRVMGDRGWMDLLFRDSFAAFKAALQEFVDGVVRREVRAAPEFLLEVVRLIELGRRA
jgi:predicted dehydrogenase